LSSKRYRPEPIVDFGLAIVVKLLVPWLLVPSDALAVTVAV
jgi:hypothetical protein